MFLITQWLSSDVDAQHMFSVVHRLFGSGMVGLLVLLCVPLFSLYVAMPASVAVSVEYSGFLIWD